MSEKRKNRPDKVEYEKRLMSIQGWMIDGNPSAMIIQNIMLKGWVKSERNAYMYYKAALERWIKYENDTREDKRKMRVQELKNQIRGMSHQYRGTPAGMRAVAKLYGIINKLEGLYFIDKDEDLVTINNNIAINTAPNVEHLSLDQIENLLNKTPDAYAKG